MEIEEYENINKSENSYWWYVGLHELVISYVKKYQKHHASTILILDAGCGTGGMLQKLSLLGQTEGFDGSEIAIQYCQSKQLQNVSLIDLNNWEPESDKYDIIISLDVLYHKLVLDDEDVLKKFNRALKKDGILILNLPAFNYLSRAHDKFVHGNKRYTRKRLKSKLKQANFQTNYVNYRMPHLFLILVFQKIFQNKETNKTDLNAISSFVNKTLLLSLRLENFFFKLRLPQLFGSSVFSVSKK